MRFEVRNPTGPPHEAELEGTLATLGRDPTCDLVLNDPKCSRRHAVIESGPDGIAIRDNGSANGVIVNGHKIERCRLREGDIIKLGDVLVTLLPEAFPGTMVMEGLDGAGDPSPGSAPGPEAERTIPEVPVEALGAPRSRTTERTIPQPLDPHERPGGSPPPAWKAVRPAAEALEEPPDAGAETFSGRRAGPPLTVTVLAALWALSVPLYAVGGVALSRQGAGARAALVAAGIALAAFSAAMAVGLWLERRWAHVAQLVVAGLGLFVCPFTLASIAVLVYMLRPEVRWRFSDRRGQEPARSGQTETMFTGALLGAVVLGLMLTATLTFLARTARTVAGGRFLARAPAAERAAVAELQAMAAAQDAFRSVCNTGFGDLEALRRPAGVVPDYPPDGPAFLRGSSFDQPERAGYRYELTVEEEMPASPGCPTRRFRRYLYSARPLGAGRWLSVGSDGVVRAAQDGPPTASDAPAK
ncbi:MAG TPA: FHA domain-containing protein [Vicinamibacteria bacterium]|nr:FHA domain-containing protein [Vicinamibacteria bacterium]